MDSRIHTIRAKRNFDTRVVSAQVASREKDILEMRSAGHNSFEISQELELPLEEVNKVFINYAAKP